MFGAVNHTAYIYLNGKKIDEHIGDEDREQNHKADNEPIPALVAWFLQRMK